MSLIASTGMSSRDRFWSMVGKQKAIGDLSSLAYPNQSELAKILLVLLHSNADQ
jgi:site-specific recombinase